jgi:NAD(P)H-dependent FMN reductase
MNQIAIISGSTRPGRRSGSVAAWSHAVATARPDAEFTLVDLAEVGLPMLDEPLPPRAAAYQRPHTRRWAATIAGFDGFVFVTPEYNHSVPAVLTNAIDYLYAEWNDKAGGFVGYGADGGVRAVEHLRQIMAEVKVAGVGTQVCGSTTLLALSLFDDFTDYRSPDSTFRPRAHQEQTLNTMLDELVEWSTAMRAIRLARSV